MHFRAWILLVCVFLSAIPMFCSGETRLVLCNAGIGSFSSKFATGVTVTVGATRVGGFGKRTCDATLGRGEDVMPAAQEAWQIDIDAMGAELGMGIPVVAFQIRDSAADRLTTYKIYSLEGLPRLLRTITGGDFYSAADINLEGRTEIWTHDAGAVDGFEDIPLSDFNFAPTVVLRFEKQRLIDVSSEYQLCFDGQIAQLKSQLDAQALAEFKNSDGRLQANVSLSAEKRHLLLATKIKVLEIVWSYLYSGRNEEAWRDLAAMWPPVDLDRIRSAILNERARGIRRQVDGLPLARSRWKHRVQIYNVETENKSVVDMYRGERTTLAPDMSSPGPGLGERTIYSVDLPPEPIFLGTPLPLSPNVNQATKIYLNLVIDAAGKVRSARLSDEASRRPSGDMLIAATTGWKFIPAFKDGHAVACRMHFGVWPYR